METGGALSCAGVDPAAHAFFAALLQRSFPKRTIVVVTDSLKTQETVQQDLETWLSTPPLFYPAWEVLPHEDKLPPADVVSDRLQTLVTLAGTAAGPDSSSRLVVTNATALLQKTFAPEQLRPDRAQDFQR